MDSKLGLELKCGGCFEQGLVKVSWRIQTYTACSSILYIHKIIFDGYEE